MILSRFVVSFVLLLYVSQQVSAQQSVRLTTGWEFLRQDLGAVWEAVRPFEPGDPASVPGWTPVTLPHCVNAKDAVDPDGNYYRGPAWYRARLNIANPYANGRTLLHFDGAGQRTEVYVYTTRVGSHTGGYDEWSVDITAAVAAFSQTATCRKQFKGSIPIAIRTDNTRSLEMIPSSLSDFNVYGGIYRTLQLVYTPTLAITQLFARPELDKTGKTGRLHIGVLMNMAGISDPMIASAQRFSIKIFGPTGALIRSLPAVLPSSAMGDTLSFPDMDIPSPRPWSTDHPDLYTVQVSVKGKDDGEYITNTKIGFRNFTFVDHGPFLLNGTRLLLRGTHRHEDHAGLGAAMTDELMRKEMILIKEMGVNFIRLAHYQQSPLILDCCDSLGILVWEEIPWCRGGLGGPVYKEQARRMLTNLIGQHFNHPSVIIWGLGNENDWPGDFPEFDKQKIRDFMTELNDLAHHLDPWRKTAIRRCDFCKDIPDIYSPSIWAGWYRGIFTEYRSATEEEFKKVPHFLHVEWGGDSHARRHSENPDKALIAMQGGVGTDERSGDASRYGGAARVSKDGDWSESYQCNLIDWHLKEQETMPWLTGTAQWAFKDFSTPLRPENPVPYVNQKGVVERDLTKKEAYFVFQSWWATLPMVHIYGHSWPVRWGEQGEEKLVKIYSNCEEATLFLNGISYGARRRNSQDFPAAGLRWKLVFRTGMNTLRVVARKGHSVVTDSLAFQYQTEKWGRPAKILLEKTGEQAGIATIAVQLVDSANIPCLDATDYLRFGMTGDGQLIDDQGTSTGSRYVQAFNGSGMIRIHTLDGHAVLSVQSGQLPTAFLELHPAVMNFPAAARSILRQQTLREADWALGQQPVTITAHLSPHSAGGRHDFYSEGDYWWPDPRSADSPYIQRDGQTNPDNFTAHRQDLIRFSRIVGALASAWLLTGDEKYVRQTLLHCRAWFVDTATCMNPHLLFAQAIKGRATGRGIGIIDTIQFMEIVEGLQAMENAAGMDHDLLDRIRAWFFRYLQWLTTHRYGKDEMNAANNHGTCWTMQVAAFARFTHNEEWMAFCRERYKKVLLPGQMAADGSFPLELKRTKPYGYSIFNLDAMTTICQLLSTPDDNLYHYATTDGRSIKKGIDFLYPYIKDKDKWPYAQDVMYWKDWPVAQPSLLFGASAFSGQESAQQLFETWKTLDHAPETEEVIRNLPVRHPLIWLHESDLTNIIADAEGQTALLLQEIAAQKAANPSTAGDSAFSPRTIEKGVLKLVPSRDWTSGFFPGECWLLYGLTAKKEWRQQAETFTARMENEKINGSTHDMGFKIECSFGNGYRLTNNAHYREVILQSARTLSTRFNPLVGCIRSWDHHRNLWGFPVIIDNMMNLELLFDATKISGDSSFYRIAVTHANTTMKNHYRPDHSSFHVVDYDTLTGKVVKKMTWQGLNDSSAWARGQAWGLYAFTICYRETGDPKYLRQAEDIAGYILHHPNLPEDKVPYWDFNAPGPGRNNRADTIPRDASAAAVIASALYELCRYSKKGEEYRRAADWIVNSLTTKYRAARGENKGFILTHSTGSKPFNSEVDTPLNYADYYYLLALGRSLPEWHP